MTDEEPTLGVARRPTEPRKWSDERIEVILESLRRGNTRSASSAAAGISRATFYRWIEEDETLRDSVEKAEAEAETRFADRILDAADSGQWTAAAWWLERRRHQEYRKREGVQVTGADGGAVQVEQINTATESEAQRLGRTLALLEQLGIIARPIEAGDAGEGTDADTPPVRPASS